MRNVKINIIVRDGETEEVLFGKECLTFESASEELGKMEEMLNNKDEELILGEEELSEEEEDKEARETAKLALNRE